MIFQFLFPRIGRALLFLLWLSCSGSETFTSDTGPFDPGKVSFTIKFKNMESSYKVLGIYVHAAEVISFSIKSELPDEPYIFIPEQGIIERTSVRKWDWRAPSRPGLYSIRIRRQKSGEEMVLNAFVLTPFRNSRDQYLNGYRIGVYPNVPYRGIDIYRPPTGLLELTPELEETPVSPHFILKQFICKQEGGYPKYILLKEDLILKLELILEKTNAAGYTASTLAILSGFRTPYYNHAIGNVRYSRHCWGGAADIFIDENPADGMMDDLNRDGKIDYHDAAILYDIVDDLFGKPWNSRLVGGLGRYKKTPNHGPFVHVDVRGFRARWGD